MSSASANPPVKKGYHHGSLHSALIDASIALAREGGPDRVVLREAARLAGVSHSAAYRHFADREALLTEVSRHARAELAAEMRRRVSRTTDPQKRLQAVGVAYIDFALNQPGLFRAAFTSHPATAIRDRSDAADAESSDAAEPYQVLGQVLDETQAAGLLNPLRRPGAEIAVWSAVHGLACLLLDGPLPATPAAVKFATGQVFDLIETGLLGNA
jgi:AcrR family transcriptional regulator